MLRGVGKPPYDWGPIDAKLGDFGGVDTFLVSRYRAGRSLRKIVAELLTLTGIRVSHETVRGRLLQLSEPRSQEVTA